MVPTAVWITWMIASLGGFVLLETLGLVDDKPGGTLSEVFWEWLGISPPGFEATRHGRVAVFSTVTGALTGVLAWLLPHILDGWGTGPLFAFVAVGAAIGAGLWIRESR